MVSKTDEKALETSIENSLIQNANYQPGNSRNFDREFAIDTEKFWQFLENTQPEQLEKLRDKPNWKRIILEKLNSKIKKNGVLSLLKNKLSIDDADLILFYSQPYNNLNPIVAENFQKKIFP